MSFHSNSQRPNANKTNLLALIVATPPSSSLLSLIGMSEHFIYITKALSFDACVFMCVYGSICMRICCTCTTAVQCALVYTHVHFGCTTFHLLFYTNINIFLEIFPLRQSFCRCVYVMYIYWWCSHLKWANLLCGAFCVQSFVTFYYVSVPMLTHRQMDVENRILHSVL